MHATCSLKLVLAAGLAAAMLACGSEVIVTPPGGSGGAPPGAGSGWGGGCVADGVRLCGGNESCPELGFGDCPGVGCTAVAHRQSGDALGAGVCWPDVENWVSEPCIACEGEDVCVHRAADELYCVPRSVCDALSELGAGAACRYSDKSAFTGAVIPEPPPGCVTGFDVLCGGSCGECTVGRRCVGRSPTHPAGLCVMASPRRCVVPSTGPLSEGCSDFDFCAVFDVAPEDDPIARAYGVCVPDDTCLEAAASMPGGLLCFDDDGTQVAP